MTPEIKHDQSVSDIVAYLLKKMGDDLHVVVGPLCWQPSDGTNAKMWYFIVATADKQRRFHCDQLIGPDEIEAAKLIRTAVMLALSRPPSPLVIHDMDDELQMARLCEVLWPGKRISKLRASVEAERH
jgi:hypothetical protein